MKMITRTMLMLGILLALYGTLVGG